MDLGGLEPYQSLHQRCQLSLGGLAGAGGQFKDGWAHGACSVASHCRQRPPFLTMWTLAEVMVEGGKLGAPVSLVTELWSPTVLSVLSQMGLIWGGRDIPLHPISNHLGDWSL